MMKRILITGAGSGFGEGAAIGLAQKGHDVIASVQIWPQVTKMRKLAESLKLPNLRVEKLDILDPYDVENAAKWDIDILVNNAATGFCGPLAEIPIDLFEETFETNVFATLSLSQYFIRQFVDQKRKGKIVFISSIAGLYTHAGMGSYCASKHALQSIAEALQIELKPYGIQIQTINPAAYKTGFNDALAESCLHWMDDKENFIKKAEAMKYFEHTLSHQKDPQDMIDAMIRIIPEDTGKFRNVHPKEAEDFIKEDQAKAWELKI